MRVRGREGQIERGLLREWQTGCARERDAGICRIRSGTGDPQEAKLGYEAVLNPELLLPRFGIDESGKGDFFGPLCVAGVYVNEKVIEAWKEAGIRDSKNISSEKR